MEIAFYIPIGLEETSEVKNIKELLSKVNIFTKFVFLKNESEEWKLKLDVLIPIAVSKRIRIKQTRRTKSLYPQLIVFVNNAPITFYPQSRGNQKLEIDDFVNALINKRKPKCLHELPDQI